MILLPGYRPDCSNHKVSQIFWTCLDTLPIAINHNTENQDQPASGHPGQAEAGDQAPALRAIAASMSRV